MLLTRLRRKADSAPQATALIVLAIFAAILGGPLLFLGPVDMTGGTGILTLETLIAGLPWQVLLTVFLLAIVAVLGWWGRTALLRRMQSHVSKALVATVAFPLVGILVFTLLLFDSETTRHPFTILALILTLNFFVGLSEELLFRGVVFGGFRQRQPLISAIITSSMAFGTLHLLNAGVGQSANDTLFQVFNATALGVLFCGLVLQGGSLWPAIILHMIWNTYAMLGVAAAEFIGEVAATAPEATPLSGWTILLPATILLIGALVIFQYYQRTGITLWAIVPGDNSPLDSTGEQA